VRQTCLDALRARLVERANIIQSRLNDENAKLAREQVGGRLFSPHRTAPLLVSCLTIVPHHQHHGHQLGTVPTVAAGRRLVHGGVRKVLHGGHVPHPGKHVPWSSLCILCASHRPPKTHLIYHNPSVTSPTHAVSPQILEQRLAAHEEAALKKFAELDAKLSQDERLKILRS
jgi:hypothetical protein